VVVPFVQGFQSGNAVRSDSTGEPECIKLPLCNRLVDEAIFENENSFADKDGCIVGEGGTHCFRAAAGMSGQAENLIKIPIEKRLVRLRPQQKARACAKSASPQGVRCARDEDCKDHVVLTKFGGGADGRPMPLSGTFGVYDDC